MNFVTGFNSSPPPIFTTSIKSDLAITYNIPDGLAAGVYIYQITFMDTNGNYITDSVTFTVEDDEWRIPGANFGIILTLSIGTIAAIIIVKKKKRCSNLE